MRGRKEKGEGRNEGGKGWELWGVLGVGKRKGKEGGSDEDGKVEVVEGWVLARGGIG